MLNILQMSFLAIDLWQVPIKLEDRDKLAFTMKIGKFLFNVTFSYFHILIVVINPFQLSGTISL